MSKKFTGTYTVLNNNPNNLKADLRKIIGGKKYDEALNMLRQVHITSENLKILRKANDILGSDHCSQLLGLLEISFQHNIEENAH